MPGPAPKHPSRRARSNSAGVVSLPAAGRKGEPPVWPLGPDVGVLAAKRVADNAVEAAELALACEEDGRRRRPLLRALEKAQLASEKLGAELEFGAEAELALWRELWATPQAVEWERAHAFRAVAVFVRLQVKGE